ncbi:MAG: hypothetical protein IJR50_00205 [Treponema sp.]|nr:hypothetical protein [Treponema sp.]
MIKSALEGFFQFSTIDQERRKDDFREGEAKGLAKGRTLGLIKGHTEGKAERAYQKACKTAKKLLLKGFSLYEIQDITGLTQEEILKL